MGFPHSLGGKESTCHAGDPGSIPGSGRSPGEEIGYPLQYSWASLVAQLVKNPPAMWEIWAWSMGWEDPLEKGKAGYPLQYSGLENSMGNVVHGLAKSWTWLRNFHYKPGIYSINLYNRITTEKYIYCVYFQDITWSRREVKFIQNWQQELVSEVRHTNTALQLVRNRKRNRTLKPAVIGKR